ncbi:MULTISPECIES: Rv3654c family TadE-like protein [Streptomyces]|uniref:Rv3654c family TadE-like protein n=3 Tax=Streptomyces TaxID=1883 RepID=UPI00382C3459
MRARVTTGQGLEALGGCRRRGRFRRWGRVRVRSRVRDESKGEGSGMGRGGDQGVGRIASRDAGLGADRGMATVWVAFTAAGLCTVFAVVLALGQAVAARHRAGGAADLAALAAADRALDGAVVACGAARRVALAQGAELVRCAVHGEIADVTARSGFGPYLPTVRARAGPPTDPRAGP